MEIKLATAKNNGFQMQSIHNLQKKKEIKLRIKQQRKNLSNTTKQQNKQWITFTYYSLLIGKITNLYKQTNLNLALRTANTIHQQLTEKPISTNSSGIYELKYNTCNNAYIGQSGSQ